MGGIFRRPALRRDLNVHLDGDASEDIFTPVTLTRKDEESPHFYVTFVIGRPGVQITAKLTSTGDYRVKHDYTCPYDHVCSQGCDNRVEQRYRCIEEERVREIRSMILDTKYFPLEKQATKCTGTAVLTCKLVVRLGDARRSMEGTTVNLSSRVSTLFPEEVQPLVTLIESTDVKGGSETMIEDIKLVSKVPHPSEDPVDISKIVESDPWTVCYSHSTVGSNRSITVNSRTRMATVSRSYYCTLEHMCEGYCNVGGSTTKAVLGPTTLLMIKRAIDETGFLVTEKRGHQDRDDKFINRRDPPPSGSLMVSYGPVARIMKVSGDEQPFNSLYPAEVHPLLDLMAGMNLEECAASHGEWICNTILYTHLGI